MFRYIVLGALLCYLSSLAICAAITRITKKELCKGGSIYRLINRCVLDDIEGKKCKVYGFTLFCGKQGGGKTYSAVKYCYDLAVKHNALLVSNIPLNVPKDVKYYALHDIDEIQYLTGHDCYVILLDEIQTLFDSRNFDKDFYTVFCQLRKRDIKIVGTAQVFERCALPLREQVHDLYYCHTYFGALTRVTKYFPTINSSGKLCTDNPRIGRYWLIQDGAGRSMYDTYYRVGGAS